MSSLCKKILSGAIAIITSINLFGCRPYKQIDEKAAGTSMEKILALLLDSVKSGEKEVFKTYFADEALNTVDFEDGYNYICAQYQGCLLSIDCGFPMGQGTDFVPGERIYRAFTTFNIITSENEYVAYIEFYTRYTSKYPEDSYKIIKFKLVTKQMLDDGEDFTDCNLRYGVYYPGWPFSTGN